MSAERSAPSAALLSGASLGSLCLKAGRGKGWLCAQDGKEIFMGLKGLGAQRQGLEAGTWRLLPFSEFSGSVSGIHLLIHITAVKGVGKGGKSSGRYLHLKFTLLAGLRTCYHNIYSKILFWDTSTNFFFLLTLLSDTGKTIKSLLILNINTQKKWLEVFLF